MEWNPERDLNIFGKLIIYGKDNISYCYGKDGLFLQKMLGQMAIGSGKVRSLPCTIDKHIFR